MVIEYDSFEEMRYLIKLQLQFYKDKIQLTIKPSQDFYKKF